MYLMKITKRKKKPFFTKLHHRGKAQEAGIILPL
jgi:hypothetical protein